MPFRPITSWSSSFHSSVELLVCSASAPASGLADKSGGARGLQAYISTALDSTGGLRSLAFWIAKKSASPPAPVPHSASEETVGAATASQSPTADGPKLWAILYWVWFVAGVIVGNDPIVLSGKHVRSSACSEWLIDGCGLCRYTVFVLLWRARPPRHLDSLDLLGLRGSQRRKRGLGLQ